VDRTFAGPGSGGIFLDIRLVVGDARLGRFPSRIAGVLSFTVIVLTGLVCGTVPSLSAFPPGLVGSNVATVPPIAVRCITIDSDISGPFLFLLTSLVGINFYYCRTTYRMLRETISLRLENESLVDHLEQERDRAQMAERAKTRFLAAASHDLRQPIHA
jgi:signal transduction histidine kinase